MLQADAAVDNRLGRNAPGAAAVRGLLPDEAGGRHQREPDVPSLAQSSREEDQALRAGEPFLCL